MSIRFPVLILLLAAIAGDLIAQPKRLPPSIRNPTQLDATEGKGA